MNEGVLHVRYAYKGFDVPLARLGVKTPADERGLKQALARYLVVPSAWLNGYVLERDRSRSDDLTLRQVED